MNNSSNKFQLINILKTNLSIKIIQNASLKSNFHHAANRTSQGLNIHWNKINFWNRNQPNITTIMEHSLFLIIQNLCFQICYFPSQSSTILHILIHRTTKQFSAVFYHPPTNETTMCFVSPSYFHFNETKMTGYILFTQTLQTWKIIDPTNNYIFVCFLLLSLLIF